MIRLLWSPSSLEPLLGRISGVGRAFIPQRSPLFERVSEETAIDDALAAFVSRFKLRIRAMLMAKR
jgi:hypothetical protein